MAEKLVSISETFNAPIDKVFNWFAVHKNMDLVFPGNKHQTITPAAGENPDGLGSVRQISVGALLPAFEETVDIHEAPAAGKGGRIEYFISKGSPLKNHRGVMLFTEQAGVTTLNYTIRFEGRIPGTGKLIANSLTKQLGRGMPVAKLILEADKASD